MAKRKKRNVLPPSKRNRIIDCEIGDVIEFEDGRRAIVTTWLNGGPMGRWLDEHGTESDLTTLADDLTPVVRIDGIQ